MTIQKYQYTGKDYDFRDRTIQQGLQSDFKLYLGIRNILDTCLATLEKNAFNNLFIDGRQDDIEDENAPYPSVSAQEVVDIQIIKGDKELKRSCFANYSYLKHLFYPFCNAPKESGTSSDIAEGACNKVFKLPNWVHENNLFRYRYKNGTINSVYPIHASSHTDDSLKGYLDNGGTELLGGCPAGVRSHCASVGQCCNSCSGFKCCTQPKPIGCKNMLNVCCQESGPGEGTWCPKAGQTHCRAPTCNAYRCNNGECCPSQNLCRSPADSKHTCLSACPTTGDIRKPTAPYDCYTPKPTCGSGYSMCMGAGDKCCNNCTAIDACLASGTEGTCSVTKLISDGCV